MRIRLLRPTRVMMPAGTELEVEDSYGALLISIAQAEPIKGKSVEKATKAPAEKRTKTTK